MGVDKDFADGYTDGDPGETGTIKNKGKNAKKDSHAASFLAPQLPQWAQALQPWVGC